MLTKSPAVGALLVMTLLMSACVSKYPASERQGAFNFPLPDCSTEILGRAADYAGDTTGTLRPGRESVCVTAPLNIAAREGDDKAEHERLERQAFSEYEKAFRDRLEAPFVKPVNGRPAFGIALSGGGSKSASFSAGVMAGLSDIGLLDQADFISTVSGGGYAAYFYYAHRLFPVLRQGGRPAATTADLYRDCVWLPIPLHATEEVREAIRKVNHCERLGLASVALSGEHKAQDLRYQAFLKCTQDVLRPGECDTRTTSGFDFGLSKVSLLGSVLLFPFSNVANTLFDWGYATSPSLRTYRDGIGLSNGATIVDAGALARAGNGMPYCSRDNIAAHDCTPNFFDPDPMPLTFDDLRLGLLKARQQEGGRMPFWIINASAPQHRGIYGWMTTGTEDLSNSDLFEMTAVSHGSGRYGYVSAPVSIYDMTVLDAVGASAAFLDANQLQFKNRLTRSAIGLGLHFANLDWGIDIPNYNTSTLRRRVHRSLPFPLYYGDSLYALNSASPEMADRSRSVFIRLIDGGNAENLGVYSLIKRQARTILLSDAAQDSKGTFDDICGLRTRLLNAPDGLFPRFLHVPGLDRFAEHCEKKPSARRSYNLHRWSSRHPILLGCVRGEASKDPLAETCQDLGEGDIRLMIMKPALDLPAFVQHQVLRDGIGPKVRACRVRGTADTSDLLNCDTAAFIVINDGVQKRGSCPIFPQHGTAVMTANSSSTMFVAYRELARQYIDQRKELVRAIVANDEHGKAQFAKVALAQFQSPLETGDNSCPGL